MSFVCLPKVVELKCILGVDRVQLLLLFYTLVCVQVILFTSESASCSLTASPQNS